MCTMIAKIMGIKKRYGWRCMSCYICWKKVKATDGCYKCDYYDNELKFTLTWYSLCCHNFYCEKIM